MLRIALLAATLISSSAQLVYLPLDKLKEEVALQDSQTDDVDVQTNKFSHPKLCDPSVKQTSGYLPASELGPLAPKYFFWLFESKSDPENDPLIMWLSGGPGCSSQLALFAENGPCAVSKDGKSTTANPSSWHQKANVMWVDQPAGVGFSTSFGTHNEAGVASNMVFFLQGFFTQFPQYAKVKFYIFGESYGGHYVPAIGHAVWVSNKNKDSVHIPLAGLAVGNGLTDPEEQYKWYAQMGRDGGKAEGGHAPGVFNAFVYRAMQLATPACIASIKACNSLEFNLTTCLASSEGCNLVSQIPYRATGKNPYDQRIKCEHGNLCYDFDHISTFLNTKEVQQQLGVDKKWGSCNYAVNLAFQYAGDWMHGNYALKLPELLHDGIQVLIYAGDCDYICNWLGNKAWTKGLEWDGKKDFNDAPDDDWQLDGKTVARLRTARGFSFMQVFDAGHMVPMDQPATALAMVNAFIGGNLSEHLARSEIVV